MNPEDRRQWIADVRRLSVADDGAAIAFGRDLIKFSQWLNGGAIAALPVVASAIGLAGAAQLAPLKMPALFFIAGLVCSVGSTYFAFLALASRSSSHLTIADAIAIESAFPDPSGQTSEEALLKALACAEKMRAESICLHSAFNGYRFAALTCAVGSIGCFVVGVAIAARRLLA